MRSTVTLSSLETWIQLGSIMPTTSRTDAKSENVVKTRSGVSVPPVATKVIRQAKLQNVAIPKKNEMLKDLKPQFQVSKFQVWIQGYIKAASTSISTGFRAARCGPRDFSAGTVLVEASEKEGGMSK